MKLIGAATGYDVDDRTAGLAVFRAIAVAQNLELLDGIDRGVYQNGAVRPHIVVVHAIHVENVGGSIVAVYREIHARQQTFILGVEVRAASTARSSGRSGAVPAPHCLQRRYPPSRSMFPPGPRWLLL